MFFNLHHTVFDIIKSCSFVQSRELTAGGPEKLKKKKKEDEAVAAASVGLFRLPETKKCILNKCFGLFFYFFMKIFGNNLGFGVQSLENVLCI